MKSERMGLAALLALGALAGVPAVGPHEVQVTPITAGAVSKATPTKQPVSPEHRAAWMAIRGVKGWRFKYPKPGWSVRQGQRMARKRKNQSR